MPPWNCWQACTTSFTSSPVSAFSIDTSCTISCPCVTRQAQWYMNCRAARVLASSIDSFCRMACWFHSGPPKASRWRTWSSAICSARWQCPTAIADRAMRSVWKFFITERIALSAMAVGHCQRALQIALDHVRQREAFGGPLWNQQAIRQKLSMLDARTRAARQFMYHCAWRVTQGHDIVQDVSMLKALTGELVNEVVQACQQFHGGMGYIRETAIERLWRDARVLAIGGGATEVMLEEVAKRY